VASAGYLPYVAAIVFCVVATGLVAAAYFLVGSGRSEHSFGARPTLPLILIAGIAISYVAFEGRDARPVFIAMYLLAFAFGALTLDLRRLSIVAGFYLGCYGGVAGLSAWLRPETTDPHREGYRLLFLGIIYAWGMMMGAVIGKLRLALVHTNGELMEALRKSESLARLDSLTGCLNYRSLMEVLDVECARAKRGSALSLLFVDLDHFKVINDTYGHPAGDETLREFTKAIKSMLRVTDSLGRYGGEEFLIVLSQTSLADARKLADRMQQRIAQLSIPALPAEARISISAGVAEHRPSDSIDSTIAKADAAMYLAKSRGRNCVVSASTA
jgi:diguanylate cyclase (GGDEF)-like protein